MKVKSLSRVRLLATPWTAAYQAPPSMGLSRQEYWSGVPFSKLPVSPSPFPPFRVVCSYVFSFSSFPHCCFDLWASCPSLLFSLGIGVLYSTALFVHTQLALTFTVSCILWLWSEPQQFLDPPSWPSLLSCCSLASTSPEQP